MKVLITGAAGFIGSNLVEHLAGRGFSVVAVDTKKNEQLGFVESHVVDIRDTRSLAALLEGVDAVVHLAALPRVQDSIEHPLETHDINVNGTLCVLEAARRAGVRRIVFASSSSVYGDQERLPLSEDMTPSPKSPYALHKRIGEEMLALWHEIYGMETVSLRFFNVYGPNMDPTGPYALVVGKFLLMAKEGKPLTITGDGSQTRDFAHVRDVARAIESALIRDTVGKGEVINIGNGEARTIRELAEIIGGTIEYIPARLEPKHTKADISLAEKLLDWKPSTTLEDGIRELKHSQ